MAEGVGGGIGDGIGEMGGPVADKPPCRGKIDAEDPVAEMPLPPEVGRVASHIDQLSSSYVTGAKVRAGGIFEDARMESRRAVLDPKAMERKRFVMVQPMLASDLPHSALMISVIWARRCWSAQLRWRWRVPLREEIARLKGRKGRPKMRPSGMDIAKAGTSTTTGKRRGKGQAGWFVDDQPAGFCGERAWS
ncbi:MAG: hypothetical protein R3C70_13935 [Geminicoccaceae bacterium]